MDYMLWKTSPDAFFEAHKISIFRVINQLCNLHYLRKKQQVNWIVKIKAAMHEPPILAKLNSFSGRSGFFSFYMAVLYETVEEQYQEEDLRFLEKDFAKLLEKYRSLIISLAIKYRGFKVNARVNHKDIVQQVTANILSKQHKIRENFNKEKRFKNYFWSCVKNEIINVINEVTRSANKNIPTESEWFEDQASGKNPEHKLMIEETAIGFGNLLNTYLQRKVKLIICLCIVMDLGVTPGLISYLEKSTGHADLNNCLNPSRSDSEKADNTIQRLDRCLSLLNYIDNTQTNAQSYQRWTNLQINSMIEILNNNFSMKLTRGSFKTLAEYYFMEFSKYQLLK